MEEIKVRITSTRTLIEFLMDAWRRGWRLKDIKVETEFRADYAVTMIPPAARDVGCLFTPLPKPEGEE